MPPAAQTASHLLINPRVAAIAARALSPGEATSEFCDSPGPADIAAAQRLVLRWKRLINIRSGSDDAFARRMDFLGLDEQTAHRRFLPRAGEPAPPAWAVLLDEALQCTSGQIAAAAKLQPALTIEESAPSGIESSSQPAFPDFLAPFTALYLSRISTRHSDILSEQAITQLARSLCRRLSRAFARTASYELKLAREGAELRGATPEQRYHAFFAEDLGTPSKRLAIFEKYPVLARLLSTITAQMIDVTAETVARVSADRDEIRMILGGGAGRVASCLPFLSDVHDGGRSAWFIEFEDGFRVMYKPRSHRADVAYAALTDWLNQCGTNIDLKAARVIAKDGYGWSEFIEARSCRSETEVARYYRRQGAHTALVYFLCGQDFHGENFIASGEYPIAIDLEGLLSPSLAVPSPELASLPQSLQSLQFTVAVSLMLPYWRFGDLDHLLFVASGIGGSGERLWPVKQPHWIGLDTDAFALDYQFEHFAFDTSVPHLDGVKAGLVPHLDQVQAGFAETYRTFLANRTELLADGSPLHAFQHIENRLVFRETQDYANLLFWTTAPDLLESGGAYDVALEVLAGDIPVFQNGSSYPEMVEEEKRSLWERDIPIAYGRPSSTTILFPSGQSFGPIIPSGVFDQMLQRLADASEANLQWQNSLIKALLHMADDDARALVGARDSSSEPDAELRIRARVLAMADEFVRTAVHHTEGASWVSLTRLAGAGARVLPVQSDPWTLRGAAGVALFLSNAARATGDPRYAGLARDGLRCASHALDEILAGPFRNHAGVSAYFGSFALVYALGACGVQLQDEGLIQQAVDLALSHSNDRLVREQNSDFFTGVAGSLAVLSFVHGLTCEPRLVEIAHTIAVEVIDKCAVEGGRQGWQVPGFRRPLLGMAHGSAGISAALLLLFRMTGDRAFLESAQAGMQHERDHIHPVERQWPNLQEDSGRVAFMTGWCAGAPGVGLSRLIAQSAAGSNPEIESEIDDAVNATLRHLNGHAHHLCCGESGRIAFLNRASQALHRDDLKRAAIDAAGCMLDQFDRHGFWRLQEFSERMVMPDILGGAPGVGLTMLSLFQPGCSEVLTLS